MAGCGFFKHQQPADNTDSKVRTDLALGNRRRHAHRSQTGQGRATQAIHTPAGHTLAPALDSCRPVPTCATSPRHLRPVEHNYNCGRWSRRPPADDGAPMPTTSPTNRGRAMLHTACTPANSRHTRLRDGRCRRDTRPHVRARPRATIMLGHCGATRKKHTPAKAIHTRTNANDPLGRGTRAHHSDAAE